MSMDPIQLHEEPQTGLARSASGQGLLDVLDRVLDKGVVIAGDIRINLLDIELLTIKIRLLIASADKAREMGIDWWEGDPFLSSQAKQQLPDQGNGKGDGKSNAEVNHRLERIESQLQAVTRSLGHKGNGSAGKAGRRSRKK